MMERLQMQMLQQKFGARTDLMNRYLSDPQFQELENRDPNVQALIRYGIYNDASMADIDKAIGLHRLMTSQDSTDAGVSRANVAAVMALEGKPYTATYMPIRGPVTAAAAAEAQAAQEAAKNAMIERGKVIGAGVKTATGEKVTGPGMSPTGISPLSVTVDPNTLKPQIGIGGTTSSSGAARTPSASDIPPVSPAALAAPASSGAGSQGNSGAAGSSTVGGAMVTGNVPGSSPVQPGQPGQLPTGTISGVDPIEQEARKGQIGFAMKGAQTDFDKQDAINQAQAIISDVRALEKLTRTGGFVGQTGAMWREYLQHHWGLSIGDTATAQTAAASLLVDTLAQVRQRMGLSTVRVGEIDPIVKPTLGSSSMPPGALNTILAQEQSGVEIDKRNVATAIAYMRGDFGPIGSNEAAVAYLQAKKANEDEYQKTRDKNNAEFGTIVEQAKRTPAADPNAPASMGGLFPPVPATNVPPSAGAPVPAPSAPGAPPSPASPVPAPTTPPAPAPVVAGPGAAAAAPPPMPVPAGAQAPEARPDFIFSGGKIVPNTQQ